MVRNVMFLHDLKVKENVFPSHIGNPVISEYSYADLHI